MKNDILKQTLLHYINLEYYANGIDEEFQMLLNKLIERCNAAIEAQKSINTKSSYNLIYKLIKEEVDKFKAELDERMGSEAELIMNEELEFLDKTYNKQSGSKTESSSKTPLVLSGITLSKVLFAPVDGRDTAEQFVERTGKNILSAYDTSLRAAYSFGQNSKVVTEQVSNKMKQVSRGMQSGIRTAIPGFANNTDREVFLLNNLEVIWVSTLDGRTCLTCASLSGLHFKSIALAPITPHNNCRCRVLPLKDVTEPVPDFEEFVESLSEEEQKHVLGKERYKLWKDYDVELKQFTNNGTVLPLDQIENEKVAKAVSNENTAKLVKKYYPNDPFVSQKISDTSRLYVSKERIKAGIKDPLVYKSDKMMASTLAKETGKDFYMLSENLIGTTNPDGFFIDNTIEMKNVNGSLRRVGLNAVRALKQAQNVFVFIQKDYPIEACLNKIKGTLIDTRQQMIKNGRKFIEPNPNGRLLIYTQGKLFEKTWQDVL